MINCRAIDLELNIVILFIDHYRFYQLEDYLCEVTVLYVPRLLSAASLCSLIQI